MLEQMLSFIVTEAKNMNPFKVIMRNLRLSPASNETVARVLSLPIAERTINRKYLGPGRFQPRDLTPQELQARNWAQQRAADGVNAAALLEAKNMYSRLPETVLPPVPAAPAPIARPCIPAITGMERAELETDALRALNIEIVGNGSSRSLSFITALLQHVTGVACKTELPEAAQALVQEDADVHRLEAEHILAKINAGNPGAAPLGEDLTDPRLTALADYMKRKYDTHLEITVLGSAIAPGKFDLCGHVTSTQVPGNNGARKIALFMRHGTFHLLRSSVAKTNPKLTRSYYLEKKSAVGRLCAIAADLRSPARRKAQKMSDDQLEAELKKFSPDVRYRTNSQNQFHKEWIKRTDLNRALKPETDVLAKVVEITKHLARRENPAAKLSSTELENLVENIMTDPRGDDAKKYTRHQQAALLTAFRKNKLDEQTDNEIKAEIKALCAVNVHVTPRIKELQDALRLRAQQRMQEDVRARLLESQPAPLPKKSDDAQLASEIHILEDTERLYRLCEPPLRASRENPNAMTRVASLTFRSKILLANAVRDGSPVLLARARNKLQEAIELEKANPARTPGQPITPLLNLLFDQLLRVERDCHLTFNLRNLEAAGLARRDALAILKMDEAVIGGELKMLVHSKAILDASTVLNTESLEASVAAIEIDLGTARTMHQTLAAELAAAKERRRAAWEVATETVSTLKAPPDGTATLNVVAQAGARTGDTGTVLENLEDTITQLQNDIATALVSIDSQESRKASYSTLLNCSRFPERTDERTRSLTATMQALRYFKVDLHAESPATVASSFKQHLTVLRPYIG